jgi:hypothetical protein
VRSLNITVEYIDTKAEHRAHVAIQDPLPDEAEDHTIGDVVNLFRRALLAMGYDLALVDEIVPEVEE